jgi:AcrR family transcriptional regulator
MSRADFADGALAVIDAEGLGALNLRRLAADLEMSPGALYTYFDGKQALYDHMLQRALRDLPLADVAGGAQRAELAAACRALFAAMNRHPGVLELLMAGVRSPDLDLMRERLLRLLADAGLDDRARVRAINLLTAHAMGTVVQSTFRGRSRADEMRRRAELDRERFPLLARSADPEHQVTPSETFEFGLTALLDQVLGARS